jgi:hypothetical protein
MDPAFYLTQLAIAYSGFLSGLPDEITSEYSSSSKIRLVDPKLAEASALRGPSARVAHMLFLKTCASVTTISSCILLLRVNEVLVSCLS